jgi:hypothetical protein
MRAACTPKLLVNGLRYASTLVHLKTAMGGDTHRGFESHALRSDLLDRPRALALARDSRSM